MVIIDNFSKLGLTFPLKNKEAQTIKDSFQTILLNSNWESNWIETDRGKVFYNNIFQYLVNENNIKLFCGNTSVGVVFAERLNRTTRDLLKKTVFENRNCLDWYFTYNSKTI